MSVAQPPLKRSANATMPPCCPTLLPTRISAVPAAWPPGGQPSLWLLLPHTPTEVNQTSRSHAAPPKVLSLARRPVQAALGCALDSRRGAERRCRTRAVSRVRRDFDPRAYRRAPSASVKIMSGAPTKCGSGGTATKRPVKEGEPGHLPARLRSLSISRAILRRCALIGPGRTAKRTSDSDTSAGTSRSGFFGSSLERMAKYS